MVDIAHGHNSAVVQMIEQLKRDTIGRHRRRQHRDVRAAPRRSSRPARTRSRSVSAPARSAPPGSWPASAYRRSPRSWRPPARREPAGVPVIGDGGMQYSGDIAKAIVAGADTSCSVRCWPAARSAPAT